MGEGAESLWLREQSAPKAHVLHGLDSPVASDTSYVSPPLSVGIVDDLVISFKHSFAFETTYDNPDTPEDETVYWDGAVIEVSTDGGKKWQDISAFGDPGYNGVISGVDASNTLLNRPAYVGRNANYPAQSIAVINLGKALAGQTAQIRLRIATDQSGSGVGWYLDDFAVLGSHQGALATA